MHLKLLGKIIQVNTAETLAPPGIFMDFSSGSKVPFPRFLSIRQFYSPHSADYFISFHIVVDIRQGESIIFQISTWEAFLLLKIIYYKNPTDFGKTVEIGADPFLPNCPLNLSLQCLVECWRVQWLWK